MSEKRVPTLPILSKVNEVGIPTKKLNTIEQKNYRAYADKVCDNVSTMLTQIRSSVLEALREENRDKIIENLAIKFKVKPLLTEFNQLKSEIDTINKESKKLATSYDAKITKLEMERDAAVAKLKNEKMLPLIEEFENHRDKVWANKNLNCWYNSSLKIQTQREYIKDDEDDEMFDRRARQVEIEYPGINIKDIITGEPKERQYLKHNEIDDELNIVMKPAIEEFDIAEIKLDSMEQAVKEVMLFDEERMNSAFQKLFEFRNSIQKKHLQVVKGINPELLNEEEND